MLEGALTSRDQQTARLLATSTVLGLFLTDKNQHANNWTTGSLMA